MTDARAHGRADGEPHPDHAHPPPADPPTPIPSPPGEYLSAVVELLLERGVLRADEVRRKRAEIAERGPGNGGRVVARAWTDPGFKGRLLDDASSAVRELGFTPVTSSQGQLIALENTPTTHHVVVCTLCSCYPTALLGPSPAWYKSDEYRSRVVVDPRGVLRDLGLELPSEVEVVVVDSTADCRYLVIPSRPAGTSGLPEDQLAALVTRDSLIGVGVPLSGPAAQMATGQA